MRAKLVDDLDAPEDSKMFVSGEQKSKAKFYGLGVVEPGDCRSAAKTIYWNTIRPAVVLSGGNDF